jgi:hypothetical protein
MKRHGYLGAIVILIAELLLFSGNQFVSHWFTPIIWTGYIFLADAFVFRIVGRSLLTTDRVELLIIVAVSIASWWLFEFYNAPRFWTSDLELWWHYHNLEPNPYLRRFGYDWAFATIFPALFLTAQLLALTLFKKLRRFGSLQFSTATLYILVLTGTIGVTVPLIFISDWLAPVVWLAFIFLLDPINYLRGWPSITADLREGNYRRLLSLLSGGGLCGILWEFWNYWAISRWTYTVPFAGNIKIFEMPLLGYLGFPPFAVECWVMYIFFRSLLTSRPLQLADNEIWFRSVKSNEAS